MTRFKAFQDRCRHASLNKRMITWREKGRRGVGLFLTNLQTFRRRPPFYACSFTFFFVKWKWGTKFLKYLAASMASADFLASLWTNAFRGNTGLSGILCCRVPHYSRKAKPFCPMILFIEWNVFSLRQIDNKETLARKEKSNCPL